MVSLTRPNGHDNKYQRVTYAPAPIGHGKPSAYDLVTVRYANPSGQRAISFTRAGVARPDGYLIDWTEELEVRNFLADELKLTFPFKKRFAEGVLWEAPAPALLAAA